MRSGDYTVALWEELRDLGKIVLFTRGSFS